LNGEWNIFEGDCIEVMRRMEPQSVHCCVTSPPYFGLRDYKVDGQVGLEQTPEEYVAKLVEVFRGVWNVLRDDGTLWLVIGDSYASDTKWGGTTGGKHAAGLYGATGLGRNHTRSGLPDKNLVGIPWRVALALQADGWYLRSDIIWAKLNPMPESVRDRPTKSHEYIFLLTKKPKYFYDQEAVKEDAVGGTKGKGASFKREGSKREAPNPGHSMGTHRPDRDDVAYNGPKRNKRDVWVVATQPFRGAHFAVYPPKLIEPCILAGVPKHCCPVCGAPWVRVVERPKIERSAEVGPRKQDGGLTSKAGMDRTGLSHFKYNEWLRENSSRTVGWKPSCGCNAGATAGTVLDPFCGTGTTGVVAVPMGYNFKGIDLNPESVEMARRRITDTLRKEASYVKR